MASRGRFSSPGWELTEDQLKNYSGDPAEVLRLLSYNTCLGFQLLQSDRGSWLLHLPGNIELAGSKSWGMLLLTREAHFRPCYKPNLSFDTCREIFESFTALTGVFSNKKWKHIIFCMKKWQNHCKVNKSLSNADRGTPLYLLHQENCPRWATEILLSALIKA